jgi:hypothetical protein
VKAHEGKGAYGMSKRHLALSPAALWPSERAVVLRKRALKEARTPPDLGPEVRDGDGKLVGASSHRPVETTEIELPPAPGSRARGKAVARRYTVECVLDAYNARGQLVDRLWRAGMKFRGDYLRATGRPRVTADYGQRIGKGHAADAIEAKSDAQKRYDEALGVLPLSMRGVVIGVCGENEWAAERMRLLHQALEVLAAHYRVDVTYCRKGG